MSDIAKLKVYCNKHTDKRIKFANRVRALKKAALAAASKKLHALCEQIIKIETQIKVYEEEIDQIDAIVRKLGNQKL